LPLTKRLRIRLYLRERIKLRVLFANRSSQAFPQDVRHQGLGASAVIGLGGGGGCIRQSINFQTAITVIITAMVAIQYRNGDTGELSLSAGTSLFRQRVDPLS
jgi:hypothetical protein